MLVQPGIFNAVTSAQWSHAQPTKANSQFPYINKKVMTLMMMMMMMMITVAEIGHPRQEKNDTKVFFPWVSAYPNKGVGSLRP